MNANAIGLSIGVACYIACGLISYLALGKKVVDRVETKDRNGGWTGYYNTTTVPPLANRRRLMWSLAGPFGILRVMVHHCFS